MLVVYHGFDKGFTSKMLHIDLRDPAWEEFIILQANNLSKNTEVGQKFLLQIVSVSLFEVVAISFWTRTLLHVMRRLGLTQGILRVKREMALIALNVAQSDCNYGLLITVNYSLLFRKKMRGFFWQSMQRASCLLAPPLLSQQVRRC